MLETGMERFRYTTDGDTAFVIDNQDGLHALTCHYVVQGVDPNQIAITNTIKRSFRRLAAARQRRAFSLLPVPWRSTRRLGALRSDRVAQP